MPRTAYLGLALGLATAVVAGALLVGFARGDRVSIEVDGVVVTLPGDSTLAQAVERLDLEPGSGDLLDVTGRVLKPGVVPGALLLNGRAAPPPTPLRGGDRIELVPGRDRREPFHHVVVNVAGGVPAIPQHTLARSPRVQLVKGRISGVVDEGSALPVGPFRSPKAVALTFDDGPSAHTRAILEVLRRLDAPATFFVVGNVAERRPDLVRRAHAYGMAVGNHSYAHPYRPPFASRRAREIREEVVRGAAVVTPLAEPPTVFRPPGGTVSPRLLEVARSQGQRVVLWSVDSEDWRPGATASQIRARVLRDVRRGSIVLLHDGGGDRTQTVKALPAIVKGIRARGFELVLLDASPRQ